MSYLLKMEHMQKSFPGVRALDDAKLFLKKGAVHALMGENGAGKSTLMKCLFGVYRPDSGDIFVDGERVRFRNPREALDGGVAMVHQELNQVLAQSVTENMFLGRFETRFGIIAQKSMIKRAEEIFSLLGLEIDVTAKMGTLSVSQRQMAEIAKAASWGARILVLDEPTSSLTDEEVEKLFSVINRLREREVGVIYISHKMEEILRISDDVTIMRDGRHVASEKAKDLTTDKIISLMVGRTLTERFPPRENKPGKVCLKVKNLTAKYQPSVRDVSFELREGEILGVAGLVGSRRTELLETLFGIRTRQSGEIELHGKPLAQRSARDAIAHGFALLTEERRATGIFPLRSIEFNAVISSLSSCSRFGVISEKKAKKSAQWVIDSMHVKTPSVATQIRTLSGGNQQKVILGRWLLTDPEVLLLDEPTRGIDVGAKYEIYQLIISLAARGKGVIVVSSEMSELLGISDRIIVLSGGRVAGIRDNDENLTQEEIMSLAAKYV